VPILTEAEKLQLCVERDRLLCSSEFARSPTMSKLLRFLVDHKLLEEGTPLTAYAVAVDGLGRDDDFDTQIDSYPRVQIGRLRRMLDHFYLLEKSERRLFIPYHHYEIILGPNDGGDDNYHAAVDPDVPGGARSANTGMAVRSFLVRVQAICHGPILAILVTALLLAIGTIFYRQKTEAVAATTIAYPAVIVKATEGMIKTSARREADIIQSHLIGALEKFDQVRVFDEDAEPVGPSQYLLESSNINDNRVQLRLVDAATREVIWSSSIEMTSGQKHEAELDRAVIDIATPHGRIAQHELSKHRNDFTAGYPCLLQFQQYIRYRDRKLLEPVLECMDASSRQFPHDSNLMSMMAIAKNISEQFDLPNAINGRREDFAVRAVKLDHNGAAAAFSVAQNAFFAGDCHRGRSWGERAVNLNPLDSRIMGYLGIYMLACDMPEGEVYSTKALQIDPDADLAVAATLAMQKLHRGEAKAAQELSARYMENPPGAALGLEISFILSSAMLGQKEDARQAWRLLAERSGFPETAEPSKVLGRWIANPDLVRELAADFKKAQLY